MWACIVFPKPKSQYFGVVPWVGNAIDPSLFLGRDPIADVDEEPGTEWLSPIPCAHHAIGRGNNFCLI